MCPAAFRATVSLYGPSWTAATRPLAPRTISAFVIGPSLLLPALAKLFGDDPTDPARAGPTVHILQGSWDADAETSSQPCGLLLTQGFTDSAFNTHSRPAFVLRRGQAGQARPTPAFHASGR